MELVRFSVGSAVCALVCLASAHASEPLRISGIGWDLPSEERVEVLEERGYSCETSEGAILGKSIVCSKDDGARIGMIENRLSFDCDVFTVCSMTAQEVAQALVNQGVIKALTREYRENAPGKIKFCERGPAGEMLCVRESRYQNEGPDIILEKGTFGQGEVKFN